MRVIERIFAYLDHHRLSPYAFERACDIANGYLKKQQKGKGTIGSEILEKIGTAYRDLNLTWVLTGRGKMIVDAGYNGELMPGMWLEEQATYPAQDETARLLREKIVTLEKALADKDKISGLLEQVKP